MTHLLYSYITHVLQYREYTGYLRGVRLFFAAFFFDFSTERCTPRTERRFSNQDPSTATDVRRSFKAGILLYVYIHPDVLLFLCMIYQVAHYLGG